MLWAAAPLVVVVVAAAAAAAVAVVSVACCVSPLRNDSHMVVYNNYPQPLAAVLQSLPQLLLLLSLLWYATRWGTVYGISKQFDY